MEFKTEALADKNYATLKQAKIRERQLVVDYVGEKSSYAKKEAKKTDQEVQKRQKDPKRLHVGGFDKSTSESDLKKLFPGQIEFAMPIKKDKGVNMGFAFVSYASEAEAKKALENLNGKEFNGRKLNVDFAFERPTENKQKQVKKEAQQVDKNK